MKRPRDAEGLRTPTHLSLCKEHETLRFPNLRPSFSLLHLENKHHKQAQRRETARWSPACAVRSSTLSRAQRLKAWSVCVLCMFCVVWAAISSSSAACRPPQVFIHPLVSVSLYLFLYCSSVRGLSCMTSCSVPPPCLLNLSFAATSALVFVI